MSDLSKLVRPLVWQEEEVDRGDGSSDSTGVHEAQSQFGTYVIDLGFGSDCYYWSVQSPEGDDLGSDFEDLSYAQAAAQADYAARIIEALDLAAWNTRAPNAVTPAELLANALELPEIKAVVEAVTKMDALLSDAFDVIDAPPPGYGPESIDVRDFRHSAYGRMKDFFNSTLTIRTAIAALEADDWRDVPKTQPAPARK